MCVYWAPTKTFYFNECFKELSECLLSADASASSKNSLIGDVFDLIETNVNRVFVEGEASHTENQLFQLGTDSTVKAYWTYSCSPLKDAVTGIVDGVVIIADDTTKQVLLSQKEKEEHEQFAELFQQAPTFMATLRGPEHRVEFTNPGYLQLIGHRDIVGRTIAEALPDAVAQGYLGILNDVYRSGEPFSATGAKYAMQIERDGPVSERYVDFVFQPIKGNDKKTRGIFVEGVDVTERVVSEIRRNALARLTDEIRFLKKPIDILFTSAKILGETLQVSRVGYGDIDPIAETLTVERDWCADGVDTLAGTLNLRDFGSFIDDLKSGKFIAIDDVALDSRTAIAAGALQERSAGSFVNAPVIERDKLVAVYFINNAEPREWTDLDLSFIKEMASRTRTASERLKNEIALVESEAKFRTITDAMPQMVWSTFPDGFHDYYNEQWYAFTGVPDGSTHGEQWQSVLHPDDKARATGVWQHSLNTGEPYEILYRLRHHSGEYRWTLGRALPIRDPSDKIIRWMGTCTDIHLQKLAEDELRQSNIRKDDFLAMLAHELRNPLAPISSAAQLLTAIRSDDKRVRHTGDIITRQVKHMTDLVDDLLDVSRLTRGLERLKKDFININDIVTNAIEQSLPMIRAREHTLDVKLGADLVVHGDKTRLVQVISNVLTNSAKYTPTGGNIIVRVLAEGSEVKITIADNGCGISSELLPVIFDTFTQGERSSDRTLGGLGLGLTLVKKLVALHDGKVSASSRGKGLGSEFTIELPLAKTSNMMNVEKTIEAFTKSDAALSVLIVDDNVDAAETLAQLLQLSDIQARTCCDGKTALEMIKRIQPNVFILDIGLPDMDGYELARELRKVEAVSNATLIALTGYGQQSDKLLAQQAGFDYHFVKPVELDELKRILDTVNH
jgi:PAS domain S-box-containing protein